MIIHAKHIFGSIILEEKEAEIQRIRHRLKKLNDSNKSESQIQDLMNQLKVKE